MTRYPDWRARLSAVVEARRRLEATPVNNCAFFVADCIHAMTGVDLAADFRGRRFRSLDTAINALRRAGYADICVFAAAHLDECHPSRARAGDVMAFPSDETGWALGIVNGERVTVLGPHGLGTLSRMAGVRAFRVG